MLFFFFFWNNKITSLKNTPTKRMEKDKSSIEILIFICLYVSANKIRFSIRRQGKNKPSWVILMVNKRGARYFPNARDRISTTSERFDQLYHESVFFFLRRTIRSSFTIVIDGQHFLRQRTERLSPTGSPVLWAIRTMLFTIRQFPDRFASISSGHS